MTKGAGSSHDFKSNLASKYSAYSSQSELFLPCLEFSFIFISEYRMAANNAFKPKLHRYAVNMAERACHVAGYALQFGLT